MGVLGVLLVGLTAGATTALATRARRPVGWPAALGLGVAGAMVGGWLNGIVFDTVQDSFFSPSTWLLALGGSLTLLLGCILITGRRTRA